MDSAALDSPEAVPAPSHVRSTGVVNSTCADDDDARTTVDYDLPSEPEYLPARTDRQYADQSNQEKLSGSRAKLRSIR